MKPICRTCLDTIASLDDAEPPNCSQLPQLLPDDALTGPAPSFAKPISQLNVRADLYPTKVAAPSRRVRKADWNDWRWQVRNRVASLDELRARLDLPADEIYQVDFPLAVTPYYLSLIEPGNPDHPLLKTILPTKAETVVSPGEAADPLAEDEDSPVPGLVHRYPDRVLLLATDFCSTYCRYCTRSRMVARRNDPNSPSANLDQALAYIESHPEVRDVLVSGGDPLTLPDKVLDNLLGRLRRIEHVEIIRLGTKTPAVLPQRITPALVRVLRKYHPLFISLHFTHPDELTPESIAACARLADAGIPLGSQTVLLKGINDDVEVMKRLMHGLLRARVRPYYLYQCDPIIGSSHFRTPVSRGLEIIAGLRGHTTGYAVPTFVIDAPGGGGKIPLQPNYVLGREGDLWRLTNYEQGEFVYHDQSVGRFH